MGTVMTLTAEEVELAVLLSRMTHEARELVRQVAREMVRNNELAAAAGGSP